jgi:hypothetical protein
MSQNEQDGWIEHDGAGCPVGPQQRVRVRYRNGLLGKGMAAKFYGWGNRAEDPNFDVVAYRVEQSK